MGLDQVVGVVAGCLAAVLIISGTGKLFLTEPASRLLAALVPGVVSLRLARVGVWLLAAAEIVLGGLLAASRGLMRALLLGVAAVVFLGFSGISRWAQNRHVRCGCLGFLTLRRGDVTREAFPPMLNAGLAVSAAGACALASVAYTTPSGAALVVGGLIGAGLVCWRALATRTLARSGTSWNVATPPRAPANADARLGSYRAYIRPGTARATGVARRR